MNLNLPFENGALGVLHGKWKLTLKTPLLIRQGAQPQSKAAFKQQPRHMQKGRGQEVALLWKNSGSKFASQSHGGDKEWSEITDFNYHFYVDAHNQLQVQYSIPASSIRGALRQWAIKNLIKRDDWNLFKLEKQADNSSPAVPDVLQKVWEHLRQHKNRWADILSLFGIAYDIDPNADTPLIWAGRLRLTTQVEQTVSNKALDAVGKPITSTDGPQNIKRHVTVRNPLDRVTMAAKEQGLHFGLEMSEGETFEVEFHILNPKPTDVELINLWHTDIHNGFLRFGGLTSQGRGRVEIASEQYRLFVSSAAAALHQQLKSLGKKDLAENDYFSQIWLGVELNRAELATINFASLEKP